MSKASYRFLAVLLFTASLGMTTPAPIEAGVIPWTYNAIFGNGPMFPRQYGYTAGYSPMYRGMNMWGANYGSLYSTNYGPGMGWAPSVAPVTSYYGPSYYGGGAVYSGDSCGCNPCGISVCNPCGGNSGCPSGNCATSSGNYSPEPIKDDRNDSSEVTPTFKPTNPDKSVPDPNDDFVPVDRREEDYVAPRTNNSTIPDTSNNNSTIPNNTGSNNNSTIPMSPIERPMAPGNNSESTIPENNRSTIPNNNRTTIPENTRSTIPSNPASRDFPPPISRPAPTEPSTEEVVPSTSIEPIEPELTPVARLVVERKRISMQAGYRIPSVSRIEVPTDRILEAGSSTLAIR